ncbi:MAG: sulfatase-like hydrolase/transferase, partial [bacterium]|nr:sulfatase-like hydrolase/transferase [bacterium]
VIARYTLKLERTKPTRPYKPVFAAMIEAVDQGVGRVVKALTDLGLEDNTLVIFSADNGGVGNITFNDPLRAGKGSLYEGGVRIATTMRWPGVTAPGSANDTPITSVDFLPTFAEIAGAKLPTSQPVDGQSFVPLLHGNEALEDRPIYWHYPLYLSGSGRTDFTGTGWRTTPTSVIRQGPWKLIEFLEDGSVELYNIPQDIGEKNDLSAKRPEVARTLHQKLKAWQRDVGAPLPPRL